MEGLGITADLPSTKCSLNPSRASLGGIDSSIVATIAVDALGADHIAWCCDAVELFKSRFT